MHTQSVVPVQQVVRAQSVIPTPVLSDVPNPVPEAIPQTVQPKATVQPIQLVQPPTIQNINIYINIEQI